MYDTMEFTLCRLCLSSSGKLIEVFEENSKLEFLVEKAIEDLLQLKVVKEIGCPWLVCSSCLAKLIDFRLFKRRCVECQTVFDNRVQRGNLFKTKFCSSGQQKEGDPFNQAPESGANRTSGDAENGANYIVGIPYNDQPICTISETISILNVSPGVENATYVFTDMGGDPSRAEVTREELEVQMPVKEEIDLVSVTGMSEGGGEMVGSDKDESPEVLLHNNVTSASPKISTSEQLDVCSPAECPVSTTRGTESLEDQSQSRRPERICRLREGAMKRRWQNEYNPNGEMTSEKDKGEEPSCRKKLRQVSSTSQEQGSVKVSSFQEEALRTLVALKHSLTGIETRLTALEGSQRSGSGKQTKSASYPLLDNYPIESVVHLEEVERKLRDKSYKNQLATELASIESISPKDLIRKMLCTLLKDSVAEEYNWMGLREKKCFSNLLLKDVISEAVKKSKWSRTAIRNVEMIIMQWLRQAKYRRLKWKGNSL